MQLIGAANTPCSIANLQKRPRRIPDYPDAFAGWNLVSSFGSLVSVVATAVFLYVVWDQFVHGKAVVHNPWAVPQYFTSDSLFALAPQAASSLEWTLASPVPFHSYNTLPVQS